MEELEEHVYSLRAEVVQLSLQVQRATTRYSHDNGADEPEAPCVQRVREYVNVLRFGGHQLYQTRNLFEAMRWRARPSAPSCSSSLAERAGLDCSGNSSNSVRAVLDPWGVWTRSHVSMFLDFEAIHVVESADGTVAHTSCKMYVWTSAETMLVLPPTHPAA